jgi:hypothetical protein
VRQGGTIAPACIQRQPAHPHAEVSARGEVMSTTQQGKQAELLVFSELLRRETDVYIPLVDQGVDAIILKKDRTTLKIQVKSTKKKFSEKCFDVKNLNPLEKDFFIICVFLPESKSKKAHEYWIIRADEFCKYAVRLSKNIHRLDLDAASQKHGNVPREELLKDCKNAWDRLTGD